MTKLSSWPSPKKAEYLLPPKGRMGGAEWSMTFVFPKVNNQVNDCTTPSCPSVPKG